MLCVYPQIRLIGKLKLPVPQPMAHLADVEEDEFAGNSLTTLDLPLESNSRVAESAIAWLAKSRRLFHQSAASGGIKSTTIKRHRRAIDLERFRGSLRVFVHEMIARMEKSRGGRKLIAQCNRILRRNREYLHANIPRRGLLLGTARGRSVPFTRLFSEGSTRRKYAKESSAGDTIVEQRRERKEFIDNIRYNQHEDSDRWKRSGNSN